MTNIETGDQGQQPTPETAQTPEPGEFDHILGIGPEQNLTVEDAAVRPPKNPEWTEVDRQIAIAAADRKLREDAGLPPRVADLR